MVLDHHVWPQHASQFHSFTESYEGLCLIGDTFLGNRQATGYNIVPSQSAMPITSGEKLVFYNNLATRTAHFEALISEMVQEGIITLDQVRFGAKASKVLYDGAWELNEMDEQLDVITRVNERGEIESHQVVQTVERVLIFSVRDDNQALRIVEKLLMRTDLRMPGALGGSWVIPDIRTTASLKDALIRSGFREVRVNVLREGEAMLLVLRQETSFAEPWQTVTAMINPRLAAYLSGFGVPP